MKGTAINPRGLFDRSTVGMTTLPQAFDVDASRIAFFAEVLGETGAIHHDRAAAQAAGYADVVAPPTFAMVIDLEAGRKLERAGHKSLLTLIRCDFSRLLHGEERYDYTGPILAGDRVVIETKVIGFEDKKGGALELAHLQARINHAERGLLVTITRSLVHRLD